MNNQQDRYSIFPYDKLSDAFMSEINQLVYASSLPSFQKILGSMTDYPKYLRSLRKQRSPLIPILEASNNTRIIDRTNIAPLLTDSIYTAQVAACCQMLMDIRLPVNQLQPEALQRLAKQTMPPEDVMTPEDTIRRTDILASMDAVRTIHLLRSLGLITRASEKMQQIALGAGSGRNDIDSIHRVPEVKIDDVNKQKFATFKVKQNKVADIILVDADPLQQQHYENLNANTSTKITAYNEDTNDVLERLHHEKITKRNLVTLLRMEHRMLPNVKEFLSNLSGVIDNDCDFILSIGSGDSIEDFEGRINKVKEFYDLFEKANLKPVIIKLHNPGTLDEQWGSLSFGHPSLASYQILYCKIDKKKIQKTFS